MHSGGPTTMNLTPLLIQVRAYLQRGAVVAMLLLVSQVGVAVGQDENMLRENILDRPISELTINIEPPARPAARRKRRIPDRQSGSRILPDTRSPRQFDRKAPPLHRTCFAGRLRASIINRSISSKSTSSAMAITSDAARAAIAPIGDLHGPLLRHGAAIAVQDRRRSLLRAAIHARALSPRQLQPAPVAFPPFGTTDSLRSDDDRGADLFDSVMRCSLYVR